ncbi:hypothetical protein [Streptomyces humi]|uniref:hypothetical protein n=1 Tax=Streptomyces humi TaxID=1428620 RepID=UPI0006288297|nr:hypothetical protein [Streptomyces humi]
MVDDIAAGILACAAVAWLVWRGFFTPPGSFGSWAMFSHICAYRVRLYDVRDGRPVSPWDHELRQDHFSSADALGSLVSYLDEVHGCRVAGEGVLLVPFDQLRIAVRNGRVVRA